jgi:hypothetical protein
MMPTFHAILISLCADDSRSNHILTLTETRGGPAGVWPSLGSDAFPTTLQAGVSPC